MNYFHRGSHAILLRVHEISIYRGGRGGGEGKGGGLIYHHLELSSLVRKNCSRDAVEGGREGGRIAGSIIPSGGMIRSNVGWIRVGSGTVDR